MESNALTAEDVATLEEIQKHRQEIAHELPKLLVDPDFEVRTDLLIAAIECVRKLGVFWGSIEVDTDPQWDGKDVDYDGIKSGPYLLMEDLTRIAGLESAVGREGLATLGGSPKSKDFRESSSPKSQDYREDDSLKY